MPHFSDSFHLETCAWRFCNTMELRSNMKKIPGKRGYFCLHCYDRLTPKKK